MKNHKKTGENGTNNDNSLVENSNSKSFLIEIIIGFLCLVGGASCILFVFLTPKEVLPDLVFPNIQKLSVYFQMSLFV